MQQTIYKQRQPEQASGIRMWEERLLAVPLLWQNSEAQIRAETTRGRIARRRRETILYVISKPPT